MDRQNTTAEEVKKIIENMTNEQKWLLLDELYDKYFNKGSVPENKDRSLDY